MTRSGDRVLPRHGEGGLDAVEGSHRELLPAGKLLTCSSEGWATNAIVATRIASSPALRSLLASTTAGISMHAVEGAADFGVAAHVGDADGEETDDRNEAEGNDAGANR